MTKQVFVSIPMAGRSDEEVAKEMNQMFIAFCVSPESRSDCTYEMLDTLHHKEDGEQHGRLWHLGQSISMMDKADVVLIPPYYYMHRGCCVELYAATMYKDIITGEYPIDILYVDKVQENPYPEYTFSHVSPLIAEEEDDAE